MLHRFDLHVHSFFSADGVSSPETLIAAAKSKGLSGFVITDHNTCEAVEYMLERGLMRADGHCVDGFLVVPGVEVSTADGHLLCVGATLPVLVGRPAVEVEQEIMRRGGIAIPAHPYDQWRAGIRERTLDQMKTRVIEVFNAAVTSREYNRQALAYAERRNLIMTAGSDAHHASAIGTATMDFDIEELTVPSVLEAIRHGGARDEKYLSRLEGMKKHLGNWFRIFNPAPRKSGS